MPVSIAHGATCEMISPYNSHSPFCGCAQRSIVRMTKFTIVRINFNINEYL
jgi:hypothetical protein